MNPSGASSPSAQHRLIFRRPDTIPAEPHSPLTRHMIPSPQGSLEILYARPEYPSPTPATPLFFIHGGFGCAAVWTSYMTLLSSAPYNIPCYALSLRGHGASWCPGYLQMVYGTGKGALADDIATGVRWVEGEEKRRRREERERTMETEVEPVQQGGMVRHDSGVGRFDEEVEDTQAGVVMVAHSNGGGLTQVALDRGDVQVKGLVLLDSAPNSGILSVYWNWLRLDPWFGLRVFWHLGHPRSPLSTTHLVKRAFFSRSMPDCLVRRFETLMSPFESLLWPMGIMRRYVSVQRVLQSIVGWHRDARPKMLVLAAERSKLMGPAMAESIVAEYRKGVEGMDDGAFEEDDGQLSPTTVAPKRVRFVSASDRVWYHVVEGAGHQLQNDEGLRESGEKIWEDGAKEVARFWEACCTKQGAK